MRTFKSFIKNNMVFSVITACEAVFLIFTAACSFHRGYSATIPADAMISSQNDPITYADGSVSVDESDVSNENTLILSSERLHLRSGAYRISILYDASSSSDPSDSSTIGSVSLSSKKYGSRIKCGSIPLYTDKSSQSQDFWIPFGASVDDLKTDIYYTHQGTFSPRSITITEFVSYRLIRFIGFVLLFLIADLIYILLFVQTILPVKRRTALSLIFITLAASLPVMTDFLYQGHDLWFHLERISSLAAELSSGHFPARMESTMLNGYGYPFSLFYGDILLYVPAFLYNMHVPLQVCYHLYVLMINAITCLTSYFAFKEISNCRSSLSLMGSLLYTLCSYRLINVFVRAAAGEYTAMAFIPLVFLGIHRMYSKDKGEAVTAHDFLPLVFGFSFIIESHILTAVITLIFLLVFFICFIKRSIRPEVISAWCWTVILVICLNLWFLLPFIESMHMNIIANDPAALNQIQYEGTYPVQLMSLIFPNITGNTSWGTKGEMTLSIGPSFVIGLILCIFMISLIKRKGLDRAHSYSACLYCLISAVSAMFISSYLFPWDSLRAVNTVAARFLCKVQFPWRYLSITSFLLTCVTLYGLDYLCRYLGRKLYRIMFALIACSAVIYTLTFFGSYISIADEGTCYSALDAGTSCIMGQEYLLSDTDTGLLLNTDVILNSTSLTSSQISRQGGRISLSCANHSDHDSSIDLPILAYENYTAYAESTSLDLPVTSGADNRLRITIPSGFDDTVIIKYEEPVLWRIAELISLLSLAFIVVHSLLTNYREIVND